MSVFIHELLCVDPLGVVSVAHLTIEDDEGDLASQEADAIYTLDGEVLANTPVVNVGSLDGTLLNGSALGATVMAFEVNGKQYYMLNPDIPADNVASVGTFTSSGVVGGISYTVYGATESEVPRPYQGEAFVQYFSGTGPVNDMGVATVTVYDDDKLIQTTTETDDLAMGHVNYQGQEGPFSNTSGFLMTGLGDTALRLVTVDYTGANGAGSFEALEYTLEKFGTTYVAYIPRAGTVDLTLDVGFITAVTGLPGTVNGLLYTDFGLDYETTVVSGTSAANVLSGTWLNDEFIGRKGADTLVGSMGKDKLYGGNGTDLLYGGMHGDTLDGGTGADTLYGRSYDDSLIGGDGTDDLFGGWGADTLNGDSGADVLQGGDGADRLNGGSENDRLTGGAGADSLYGGVGGDTLTGGTGKDVLDGGVGHDELRGGAGADRFVFANDGVTDRLLDFQDGVDLIDLDPFVTLTVTTVAAGTVRIEHSGEVLIVTDLAGTLTAADLTASDFV